MCIASRNACVFLLLSINALRKLHQPVTNVPRQAYCSSSPSIRISDPEEPLRIMTGLIAKKIGMSRVFQEDGSSVPVTYVQVEPNTIVRTKSAEKDGYNAVVLGVGAKKWKTRKGNEHTKYALQKEWKVEALDGMEAGKEFKAEIIPAESLVTVTGTSKGKGFQGVVKRHKFSRGPETHGSHHHRRPGSIGMKEWPGRVLKGKKMPGRMGNDTVTLQHRPVIACDVENGVLAIKGPIPGPNGSRVFITVENIIEQ
jgi:large subunit ribosomal protein L3